MINKNKLLLLFVFFGATLLSQNFGGIVKVEGLLKRIKHTDTLYVVNFWATWCKPCVQELPAFDSLSSSLSSKPIKVLLVSLDFSEELNIKVLPFLQKRNITSTCLLLDETNANEFINKISKEWSGAIPATLFKKGDETVFKEKKFKLKDLEQQVLVFGL